MTYGELWLRRTMFGVCVGMAIVAGLWAHGWYIATPAIYSDLTQYGIEYSGEAYDEIVAITERHIWWINFPVNVVLIASLVLWGIQIHRDTRALRTASPTSTKQVE